MLSGLDFVSLMFCVLDNNIRNFKCVLSGADFTAQEMAKSLGWRLPVPDMLNIPPSLRGIRKMAKSFARRQPDMGPDILARGQIIRPPPRVLEKSAKDFRRRQPDTGLDIPARGRIIRPP
jgi:hypothetical protein